MWSIQIRANGFMFYGQVTQMDWVDMGDSINLCTDDGDIWVAKESIRQSRDGKVVEIATECVTATIEWCGG